MHSFGKAFVVVTILLDVKRCAGHGLCAMAGPDVYELDDEGYCATSGQVPESLRNAALEGASACPEQALTIAEDAP